MKLRSLKLALLFFAAMGVASPCFATTKKGEGPAADCKAELGHVADEPTEEDKKVSEEAMDKSRQASELLRDVEALLEPYTDPFMEVADYKGALGVYTLLGFREGPGRKPVVFKNSKGADTHDSPAEQMRKLLNRNIGVRKLKYEPFTVDLSIEDAKQVLEKYKAINPHLLKAKDKIVLYSAAHALKLSNWYLRRFMSIDSPKQEADPDPKTDKKKEEEKQEKQEEEQKKEEDTQEQEPQQGPDGEPNDQKKDQKKKDEKKKDEKKKEKPPETYPKVKKNEKPGGDNPDDNESEDGGDQKKYEVAESNVMANYYKVYHYNMITRGGSNPVLAEPLHGTPPAVEGFQASTNNLKIRTFGQKEVDVYHVPGYELRQPEDPRARLRIHPEGHYVLKVDPGVTEVELPMVAPRQHALDPISLGLLSSKVGFRLEEFPEKMRAELLEPLIGKQPEQIARQVEQYLQHSFLYSKKTAHDAIDALNEGEFHCRMAAYTMVSVLRDLYDIPSRIAHGFPAKLKKGDSKKKSYLVMPQEAAHWWVEAYIDGHWKTYDPTPVKQAKEDDKKKSGEEEYRDVPREDQPDQSKSDGKGEGESSDQKNGEDAKTQETALQKAKRLQDKLKADTKKSLEEKKNDGSLSDHRDSDGEKQGSKDKEKGEKSGPGEETGEETGHGKDGQSGDPHEKGDQGHQKGEKTEPGERADEKGHGQQGDSKDKTKSDGKEKGKEQGEGGGGFDGTEYTDPFPIGDLTLRDKKKANHDNPFTSRALRIAYRNAINPTNVVRKGVEYLNQLLPIFRDFGQSKLIERTRKAIATMQEQPNLGLVARIQELGSFLRRRNLNTSYVQLHRLIRQIEMFHDTLDPNGHLKPAKELLKTLKDARNVLHSLNGANAADVTAVNEFVKSLPPLSRQLIHDKYQLKDVGSNPETVKIAKELRNGTLFDYQLIGTVNSLTDFILSSTPSPEYRKIKSFFVDTGRATGPDLVQVENPADMYRGLALDPKKSTWENFMQGTLYIPKTVQTFDIPDQNGVKDEEERISVLLYDTSGSMMGNPGDLQAALIASFTDKAASDKSPSGRSRHKALLMGFDDSVHTTHMVTNDLEAKEVIRNYRQQLGNTQRGTNIQGALITALKEIANAQKKNNNEPLKKANIILMTDGQANIDLAELRKYREAIDGRTDIEIMLVSINGTNPELMKFALESGRAGFQDGFYREFTPDYIGELMRDAKTIKVPDKHESFTSDRKIEEIPQDVDLLLEKAYDQARDYTSYLQRSQQIRDPDGWYSALEVMRQPTDAVIDRPLIHKIGALRAMLYSQQIFNKTSLGKIIVDDVMKNFHLLSDGIPLDGTSHTEFESIRHMLTLMGATSRR